MEIATPFKVKHRFCHKSHHICASKNYFFKVLIFVMTYSLFCHNDLDNDFDDSFDDEETFVNEDDDSWYDNDKLVKTKIYR